MRTSPNSFKSKQKQIPFKSVVWCPWCKEEMVPSHWKGCLRRVCWSEIPAHKRLSQRVCDFKTSMASLNKTQQLELLPSIQRPFDVHFLLMSRGLGLGSVKARQKCQLAISQGSQVCIHSVALKPWNVQNLGALQQSPARPVVPVILPLIIMVDSSTHAAGLST